MTRIHICAGQGRFGINIENGKRKKKKDPQSRATPHVFPGPLAFKCQRPPLPSEEGLWGSVFPSMSRLFSFGVWTHPPNPLSFGKYQPPAWLHPGPSPTSHNYSSSSGLGSPWSCQFSGQQPAARASVWPRTQPRAPGLASWKPCSQTLPFPKLLLASSHIFRLRGKRFSFSCFQSGFWFSFCGSALPRLAYRHQSWNQLCLFVGLSFPWNLRTVLGYSVFLIIKKVIHMATKEGLGSKKPQTHRRPSVALPLTWMTGSNN